MDVANTNATYAATLVDEWIFLGLRAAFVAPGSRSTPLAVALTDRPELTVEVFHDERSASFAALGHGLATGLAAVLLCTSGTAGTHFHAAVAEADASGVPLLVVTADRPPRLWGIGAPQTIAQQNLYGSAVRAFVEPGVPSVAGASAWRETARTCWSACFGGPKAPGPVQLNSSFEEPLLGEPEFVTSALGFQQVLSWPGEGDRNDGLDAVLATISGKAGIIVAGRGVSEPDDVVALSAHLNWPLIADHRSGCRQPGQSVEHADSLLRVDGFADGIEVAVVFGEPLSSKVLGLWLGSGVTVVAAMPPGRWLDPQNSSRVVVPERGLARQLMVADPGPQETRTRWMKADSLAESVIARHLVEAGTTEPGVLRSVAAEAPSGSALMVSSSMPVRDLEWFAPGRSDVRVFANRGANGIDGVTSTAIGIALTGLPTNLVLGDLAFLHDSNALISLRNRNINLTIIVIDNDGGGIFSFLPQAELLPDDQYEKLFGTPHGADLAVLARAHGLTTVGWDERGSAIESPTGVQLVIAHTNRRENVKLHKRLNTGVEAAIQAVT